MANSTTNATFVEVPSEAMSITVGVGYLLTGIIFSSLQGICAWLMHKDKEMQNPTYRFMVNVCISDLFELQSIGIYAGISILIGKQNEVVGLIMGSLVLCVWYPQCVLFVFIAFSRWISLTRPHLASRIFKKHVEAAMHIVPYAIMIPLHIIYTVVMLPSHMVFFYPTMFTWGFGRDHPIGEFLYWNNFVFNSICAFIEAGFNISSLIWVHKTRKAILSIEASANRKREVKLLVQCFIIGTFFFMASTLYTIVFAGAGKETMIWCLLMQLVWTSNHCVNPVVYLWVNTRLRRRFLQMMGCDTNKVGSTTTNIAAMGATSVAVSGMATYCQK